MKVFITNHLENILEKLGILLFKIDTKHGKSRSQSKVIRYQSEEWKQIELIGECATRNDLYTKDSIKIERVTN